MTALVRYEAARNALVSAQSIDEVKDIRDKAEALSAYARQAKDQELIQLATEIKVRAERRAGEMLSTAERATGRENLRHSSESHRSTPTLADIGITRDQSSRWQRLAAMTPEHFDAAVETAKAAVGEVTSAFMLREARGAQFVPALKPERVPQRTDVTDELDAYRKWHAELRRITGCITRPEITTCIRNLMAEYS